jgi:hypothetical protein
MDSFKSEAYEAFMKLTSLEDQQAWLAKYLTPELMDDYNYTEGRIKHDLSLVIEEGTNPHLRIVPRTGVASFTADSGEVMEDCIITTLVCFLPEFEARKHCIHFVFNDEGHVHRVLWTSPETIQDPATGAN